MMGIRRLLVVLLLMIPCLDAQASSGSSGGGSDNWSKYRENHNSKAVTMEQLKKVAQMSDMTTFRKNILEPFLRRRVPGSRGNKLVQEHIIDHMESLGWQVTTDSFEQDTPLGRKNFTNIVAVHKPEARRWFTLACHFDSKYFKKIEFVGATDSAVPCSMMMDLARLLNDTLWGGYGHKAKDISLQFIFFDGEEAFIQWSDTDSIYGSRHLAEKMSETPFEPEIDVKGLSDIDRFDAFVLLDLIGVKNPTFRNWFSETDRLYERLKKIEKRLVKAELVLVDPATREKLRTSNKGHYFQAKPGWASRDPGIGDDHVPFFKLGVPILHLIPFPFPSVWHTKHDNISALDFITIDNLNKIFRVFVVEYLHLSKNL